MKDISTHISKLLESIDLTTAERLIQMILTANRVFLYGAGRSGFVARCFAQRLMHIDVDAYFISETITPSCRSGDLLIVVSGSGETPSSIAIAEAAQKLGANIVAVSTRDDSPLANHCRLVLRVPGKTKLLEKESYAPFTTLFDISALTVLDSISAEIMRRKGISDKDILQKHASVE